MKNFLKKIFARLFTKNRDRTLFEVVKYPNDKHDQHYVMRTIYPNKTEKTEIVVTHSISEMLKRFRDYVRE